MGGKGGGDSAGSAISFTSGEANKQFDEAQQGIDKFQTSLGDILPDFLSADFGSVDIGEQQRQISGAVSGVNQAAGSITGVAGGLGQDIDSLRGLGNAAAGISRGSDPAFDRFRNAQLALSEQQRADQTADQDAIAQRGGFAGSSASANQQARLDRQFNLDQAGLSSNIGLAQLNRQDQARAQAGGLFGQAAGVGGLQGQLFGQAGGLSAQAGGLAGLSGQLGIAGAQANAGFQQQGFDTQMAGLQALLGSAGLDIGLLASILPFSGIPAGGGGTGPTDTTNQDADRP